MNLRALSALIIYDVLSHGRSLSDALPEKLLSIQDPRDAALVQAICYGVLRHFYKLTNIAKNFLAKPLKNKDQDIYFLILVGLYQLIDMRIPGHAAVSETVDAAKALHKIWAKNLINGILREYLRSNEVLTKKLTVEEKYEHPSWLIGKIKKSWPNDFENIFSENNAHPPFSLRVNQQKISREDYLKELDHASIIPETKNGIVLENPVRVEELPFFKEGFVSVQDGAPQIAAELLDLKPGLRVLDACAAPGGKTSHILEEEPKIDLLAIDRDQKRLESIVENFSRLQLSAKILCADAGDVDAWWDGKFFDRILLDAPCSALGVIRRHPDIKFLRRYEDIAALVNEQKRLLNALWKTLVPGGILLYATCSILPEENFLVLKSFLEEHPDAFDEKIQASWGIECEHGRQILPGMHGMDGFYYGRLRKE